MGKIVVCLFQAEASTFLTVFLLRLLPSVIQWQLASRSHGFKEREEMLKNRLNLTQGLEANPGDLWAEAEQPQTNPWVRKRNVCPCKPLIFRVACNAALLQWRMTTIYSFYPLRWTETSQFLLLCLHLAKNCYFTYVILRLSNPFGEV